MSTKLTALQVDRIRMLGEMKDRYGRRLHNAAQIAEIMLQDSVDVTPETIRRILRGESWRSQPFKREVELSQEAIKASEQETLRRIREGDTPPPVSSTPVSPEVRAQADFLLGRKT